MDWKHGKKPKPSNNEYFYLIWMYDTEVEIGYCNPKLGYINGEGKWVDFWDNEIESEDGVLSVTAWFKTEIPKNKKLPTIK
jgi:hypothetical protein